MEKAPSEDATQPSLLLRMRDPADAEAWETFVTAYAPLVYGYCRKRGLQDADASDVVQDVLTEVSRSIRGFAYDREKGRFRDWLRTVTRCRLARFLDKRPRSLPSSALGPLVDELPDSPADAEWADDFHARVLQVALARVRPRFEPSTWGAFERTWLGRAQAPDVARELGMAIDVVYVAKSRVLKQLRAEVLMLAEDLTLFVPLDG
jgi:RNA polymerase sigma-70 factor (ECF subfamily)